MQKNAKMAKEDHDTHSIPKELESRNRSLSEAHKAIRKKQATQEEELHTAEASFVKQIRVYKMHSKLKKWVK